MSCVGVATDGAPAMVRTHNRLVSLSKKEVNAKEITHNKLVFCQCVVHQQSLCTKSVRFDHVISLVTDCINVIKKEI